MELRLVLEADSTPCMLRRYLAICLCQVSIEGAFLEGP